MKKNSNRRFDYNFSMRSKSHQDLHANDPRVLREQYRGGMFLIGENGEFTSYSIYKNNQCNLAHVSRVVGGDCYGAQLTFCNYDPEDDRSTPQMSIGGQVSNIINKKDKITGHLQGVLERIPLRFTHETVKHAKLLNYDEKCAENALKMANSWFLVEVSWTMERDGEEIECLSVCQMSVDCYKCMRHIAKIEFVL